VHHVLAVAKRGAILLLASDELVISFHAVGCLANLRGVVMEATVHVLHVHHIHIACSTLDQRKLFDVAHLVIGVA